MTAQETNRAATDAEERSSLCRGGVVTVPRPTLSAKAAAAGAA